MLEMFYFFLLKLYISELLPSSLPGWPSHSLMKFPPILFWILHLFCYTYCPRKMRQRSGLWSLLTTTLQLLSGDAMEDFCLLLIQRLILKSLGRTQGLHKGSWIASSRPHNVCPFSKTSRHGHCIKDPVPHGEARWSLISGNPSHHSISQWNNFLFSFSPTSTITAAWFFDGDCVCYSQGSLSNRNSHSLGG